MEFMHTDLTMPWFFTTQRYGWSDLSTGWWFKTNTLIQSFLSVQRNGVAMTLLGHQDVVTNVAWVSDVDTESMEQYLVSGSADGSIIFWKVNLGLDQNTACPWEVVETFECPAYRLTAFMSFFSMLIFCVIKKWRNI